MAKRALKPKTQKNPFTEQWPMVLTRESVDKLIVCFVQAFNVLEYLGGSLDLARKIVDSLRNGICARILYHVAHYLHAIYVDGHEDIADYMRLRSLWHIHCKQADDSILAYRELSLALMMIKVCVFVVFDEQMGPDDPDLKMVVEATVYRAVDELLNPFEIYDSLEKPEDYRVAIRRRHLPRGKRELEDIRQLHEAQTLPPYEDDIALLLLAGACDQLLTLLGQEKWGDKGEYEGTETIHKYKMERMTQKLIEHDLAVLNREVPRQPPSWIVSRKSKNSALDLSLEFNPIRGAE
jgi:hypothetical protein